MNNFICWCLASNDACITKKSHLHIHETLSKKTIVVWTTHIGIFFSLFFAKPYNTFKFCNIEIKISYSVLHVNMIEKTDRLQHYDDPIHIFSNHE